MDEFEVVCVDRELYHGGGSRIFQLGVRRPGGGAVAILSEGQIQRSLRSGDRYYVVGGGTRSYLTIAISERGNAFVETQGDQTLLDNLAALPPCQGDRPAPHRPGGGSDPNDVDGGFDGGDVEPEGPDTDVDQGDGDD